MAVLASVNVRWHILQLVSVAILLVVFGSHVSELLDHWDHTLQTGNDVESVLIVLALTGGVVLAIAGAAVVSGARTHICRSQSPIAHSRADSHRFILATPSPPPLALRI
jgi:hypothetical protein